MYEVLIIENDPMVAMINKQYVNQNPHFHVAAICRDGTTGLEYLLKHTVHLVLLDLYIPRMDGLSLLRQIRQKQLPVSVIIVTAANDSSIVEEALRLGIVDYLIKPFFASRFQQALETFLSRQDIFHGACSLSQHHIDSLISSSRTKTVSKQQTPLPKGIQDQTLETLCKFLESNPNTDLTGEEIADRVGLSRVTVRRYMNYLLEKNFIIGHMNYETGGRPSMRYRWNGSQCPK